MQYEVDFEMPLVHAGNAIGMTEGRITIQTFNQSWFIAHAYLRNSETFEMFEVGKGGPMFRVIQHWIEYHKGDQISELILSVAA